jgi:hypothetical protein
MSRPKTAPWKIALAAIFCVFGVATVIGHYWVSYRVDQDVSRLKVIVSSLQASDSGYGKLKVIRSSHPKAWIFGEVDSQSRIDDSRTSARDIQTRVSDVWRHLSDV